MNGEGSQLAQVRPGGTAAVSAYTNPSPALGRGLNAEITLLVVCNTSAAAANFSIYHDNSGTPTFDQSTALYYGKSLAANDTVFLSIPSPNAGIAVKPGGQIGFQSSVASALTFTVYGVTQQVSIR